MSIHANSAAAYHSERLRLSDRAQRVLGYIAAKGPATDRQVMQGLGFSEPNSVRPRITELIEAGLLIEASNTKCPVTGKTVRVVDVPRRIPREQLSLLEAA